jgi:inner membrane protein
LALGAKWAKSLPDALRNMASLGHIAVGMAAARIGCRRQASRWSLFSLMVLWSCVSFLPDVDVLGFRFGVAYSDTWGHRGATHSFVFSAVLGVAIGVAARLLGRSALRTAVTASGVLASHAVLDTLTDGGLGCALLWPFDDTRYFAPWNPIPVAPIGGAFLSATGLHVAMVEALLFAPLLLAAMWPRRR